MCLLDSSTEEGLIFNVIDESLKVIDYINREVAITKEILKENMNIPENLLFYLIDHLVNKEHIQITNVKNREVLSLTEKGREHFKSIFNKFTEKKNVQSIESSQLPDEELKNKLPPFIGALVSDKYGKLLVKFEIDENLLDSSLGHNFPLEKEVAKFEIELIPMFISALEKFSSEININDLTGFGLEGSNLKMQIYSYDDYTVIFFLNPNINLEPVNSRINKYFENLFRKYENEFDVAKNSGNIDILFPIKGLGRKWLKELNNIYTEMIINFEIYDIQHAKILYSKFDDLYSKVESDLSVILEKIKKLKVNLVKSILEKDFDEIKKIAKLANDLNLKYTV